MKPKIYDCITFFQSELLFNIRFNLLKDIVDYFVVCEATRTHTGKSKKINFNYKKWRSITNKIIFIKVTDIPKIELTQKNKFDLIKFQIEKLFLGINSANDNDLIILSDEDEIPNPKKIKEFNYKKYKFGIFMQNLYYYKLNILNLENGANNWPGSRICLKKNLKSFFDFKILKIKNSSAPFWKFYKEKSIQKINKGGWHFSYLMSPKTISEKIKNSGHIEYNSSNFTNIKNIQKKIKEFKDLFDRNMRLKKVNINKSYPQYILHNKNKLKRWIA